MKKPIVFMFSGQGSQYYHMGKELYENHSRFRLWMNYCDEIVQPLIQRSLIEVMYNERIDKHEPFDEILYTNPALLSIEYSLARILTEMDVQPDYVLGYSIGEVAAAVISGVLSLEEGFQFVVGVAKLLEAETPPAGMLAVIEPVEIMDQNPDLFETCWLTGNNFQKNFVISGLADDISHIQSVLKQRNMISQRLPVNYGFHTRLIDPIEEKFKQLGKGIHFSESRIPIISCLKSKEIEKMNEDHFWKVLRHPVAFEKTIQTILQKNEYIFIDVGPSGSLSTFVKYLLPFQSKSFHFEMINQFGKNLSSIEKFRSGLHEL
jgi:acyl transferase domain-containing protein